MAAVNYQRRNNQHDVETVELVQGRVLRDKQPYSVRRYTIVLCCNNCIHGLETEAVMKGALNYGNNGLLGIAKIWEVSDYNIGLGLQFAREVRLALSRLDGEEISGCNKCKGE
ncbi:hypothetical protein P8452_18824 [Trifolium repens]|nr:hypothetical protein P8452_18824 [Trifolium repens]